MKFLCDNAVLNVDQRDLVIEIAEDIQAFRQFRALDFDQIFGTILFTLYRLQKCNGLRLGIQMQQAVNVHDAACGNVVNDDTILNRLYV